MLNEYHWGAPIDYVVLDSLTLRVSDHLYWHYDNYNDSYQLRNDIISECNSTRIPRYNIMGRSRREVIGELIVDMWYRARELLTTAVGREPWTAPYIRQLLNHLIVLWTCHD